MKISQEKKEKISEQILALLYSKAPESVFTSFVSTEIARDEEFVKKILGSLKIKGLIIEIKKNPLGATYKRRSRWKLSDATYEVYKKSQT